MQDIKTTAEYYRRGLLRGLVLPKEAMAWIDNVLITDPAPDITLIEASLSGSHGPIVIAGWLAQTPGEFDNTTVVRRLLSAMLAWIDQDPTAIPQVTRWLRDMAWEDDWPDLHEEGRMWAFWDDFDLAVGGSYGDPEEIRSNLRAFLLRASLLTEVKRFRDWAQVTFPNGGFGEWECDYPHWDAFYPAVLEFLKAHPFSDWAQEEVQAVLYALARDNEGETIAENLQKELLLSLARASQGIAEPEARGQLADRLGFLEFGREEAEVALLVFAQDEDEYVRRMALRALANLGSDAVERLALAAWERPDPQQEYARIMALTGLKQIGSPRLEALLVEAEQDTRPYLRACAERIRRGE